MNQYVKVLSDKSPFYISAFQMLDCQMRWVNMIKVQMEWLNSLRTT